MVGMVTMKRLPQFGLQQWRFCCVPEVAMVVDLCVALLVFFDGELSILWNFLRAVGQTKLVDFTRGFHFSLSR
jgi:hypothetical protein